MLDKEYSIRHTACDNNVVVFLKYIVLHMNLAHNVISYFVIVLVYHTSIDSFFFLIGRDAFAKGLILKGSFILEYRGILCKKKDIKALNEYTYVFRHRGTDYW